MRYLYLPLYAIAGIAMLVIAWSAMLLAVFIGAPLLKFWHVVFRGMSISGASANPGTSRKAELFKVY